MLEYVPVRFDLYRAIRPALRWTLQCLTGFADTTGRCWPSVRTLAAVTGQGKSTVARHLAMLAGDGIITRQRRPGGSYAYVVDSRFLPAQREVSHARKSPVPTVRTEEQVTKNKGFAPARFAGSGAAINEGLPDLTDQWRARVGSWQRSGGKFWLPQWGPTPSEAGCFVPLSMLTVTR